VARISGKSGDSTHDQIVGASVMLRQQSKLEQLNCAPVRQLIIAAHLEERFVR